MVYLYIMQKLCLFRLIGSTQKLKIEYFRLMFLISYDVKVVAVYHQLITYQDYNVW